MWKAGTILVKKEYFGEGKNIELKREIKEKAKDIYIDPKEFSGPIYEKVDDAYHFVLRHIDLGAEIEGEYGKDVYELPISAAREMNTNAVLHRSYLDKACVQVCLYDTQK